MKSKVLTSAKHGRFRVLLDDKDVEEYERYHWGVKSAGGSNKDTLVVYRNETVNGVTKHVLLHKHLLPEARHVAFKNGNHFDNRRQNLVPQI